MNDERTTAVLVRLFAEARYSEAESVARGLIKEHPDSPVGWKALGTALGSTHRPLEAIQAFDRALEAVPADAETLTNLGVACRATGQRERARGCFEKALTIQPAQLKALLELGHLFNEDGHYEEAQATFEHAAATHSASAEILGGLEKALLGLFAAKGDLGAGRPSTVSNPQVAGLYFDMGNRLRTQRRMGEAEQAYRRALGLKAEFPEALNNLGTLLAEQGRPDAAENVLRRAVSLRPREFWPHCNLGNVYRQLGRRKEAEMEYQAALRSEPRAPQALNNMAALCFDQGRFAEAERHALEALNCADSGEIFAKAHANLGNISRALGRLSDAEEHFRIALQTRPELAEAHGDLGSLYREQGRLSAGEQSCRQAIRLSPGNASTYLNLGNILSDLGRFDDALEVYELGRRAQPANAALASNALFLKAYASLGTADEYLAAARKWEQDVIGSHAMGQARARRLRFTRKKRSGRRLRIGYVSGDFGDHPVQYFIEPILRRHDRDKYEISVFSTQERADRINEQMRGHVDHWHALMSLTDEEALGFIDQQEIDVLVDLSGHSGGNRVGIFARRAAPVQTHYLGYFASTGVSQMDYWIGDAVYTPQPMDLQFSERVWRLPRTCFAYLGPEHAPRPDWHPDPDGRVRFGSFNALTKVTARTIDLWAEILKRTPRSILILKSKDFDEPLNRTRILGLFDSCGIEGKRIQLRGRLEWAQHMSLYDSIDVALDPIGGLTGGTTTCEALWMGVPVVALRGATPAGRLTATLLAGAGRSEWATNDRQSYIECAQELARHSAMTGAHRGAFRDRMRASPLCDAESLARSLEQAYETMFDDWQRRRAAS